MTDWHNSEERERAMAAKWAEAEDKVKVLRELVQQALTICEGLAEQQMMPDDWWVAKVADIRAALEATK